MNKIIHIETKQSNITIPKFDGFARPAISFKHEIERFGSRNMKAEIKVFLKLIADLTEKTEFNIFNTTSTFDIIVTDDITEDDFFELFNQSENRLIAEFLRFQLSQNIPLIKLKSDSKEDLLGMLSNLVAWYYSP